MDTEELLKKIVETIIHEEETPVEYEDGFTDGYAAALADVCAGLRTKRTAGGETITSAVHAAEVIERGDFTGLVSGEALRKKIGVEIVEVPIAHPRGGNEGNERT